MPDRLLSIHDHRFPVGGMVPPHRHDDRTELFLVVDGVFSSRIGERSVTASPGSILIHPLGIVHSWRIIGAHPARVHCVAIRGSITASSEIASDAHGRIRMLCRWILGLGEDRHADRQTLLETLLLAVVDAGPDQPEASLASRLEPWVDERIERQIRIIDLAKAVGLSPFHFARRFQSETGTAPAAWLLRRRLAAAQALIISTSMPMREVAERCGLGDGSRLARCCRRILHTNPSSLRPGMH